MIGRETERAGQEGLGEERNRRKPGQSAAQEEQRHGQNTVWLGSEEGWAAWPTLYCPALCRPGSNASFILDSTLYSLSGVLEPI